ncbi:hypothetical protein TNCV_2355041 [Trichonephila clavipes]|nr:hypothetical protein TNCV_2355041 [Trichonephila clavipes]
MARKWSSVYGISSKQMVLSPGRSAMCVCHRPSTSALYPYLAVSIRRYSGQRCLILFMILLMCLEDEFPGKQSTAVLQRLPILPAFSVVLPFTGIQLENRILWSWKKTTTEDTT